MKTFDKSSLLRSSAAPAVGTALSRVTGLMRVAALTAALGLTSVADVYNLANTAPNILYELVIGGVLSSTLVPLFIHADEDPADDSASVSSNSITSSTPFEPSLTGTPTKSPSIPYSPSRYAAHGRISRLSSSMDSTIWAMAAEGA